MFELPKPPKISQKRSVEYLFISQFFHKSKTRRNQKTTSILPLYVGRHFNRGANIFLISVIVLLVVSTVFETRNRLGIDLLMIGLAGFIYIANIKIRRSLLKLRWLDGVEMKAIDEMPGHEFEQTCAEIYRRLGYSVKVTQRTRDHGADLIMEGSNGRVVVQAKRQASSVGNWAVQEICAAKGMYKAAHAIVITNNTYTAQAVELAKANTVELVDRNILAAMLAKVTNPASRVNEADKSDKP